MEDSMANKKEVIPQTVPISVYLKTTKHRDSIKNMMKTLYPEVSKTMEDWEIEDDKINKGRC